MDVNAIAIMVIHVMGGIFWEQNYYSYAKTLEEYLMALFYRPQKVPIELN
jgi:hypothetical protein